MSKKVISYKLNSDGSIPDFVEEGGYLPKNPENISTMILIGISKDKANTSDAEQVFDTKSSVISYVSTYLEDKKVINNAGVDTSLVISDVINMLFDKAKT